MTELKQTYLARSPDAMGYWGKHPDGPHHAIATCCEQGANRFGLFLVFRGPESMVCDGIHGGLQWEGPADEPTLEGVYTASGAWVGDSLTEVAKDLQSGMFNPEEFGIDRKTVEALRYHLAKA